MVTARAATPPSSSHPDERFKQVELWENNCASCLYGGQFPPQSVCSRFVLLGAVGMDEGRGISLTVPAVGGQGPPAAEPGGRWAPGPRLRFWRGLVQFPRLGRRAGEGRPCGCGLHR